MYNSLFIIYIITWILIFILFLWTNYVRHKFILFFFNLFYFVILGFYFNLDGIMLILLITEIMVLFIFFLLHTQINIKLTQNPSKHILKTLMVILSLFTIVIFSNYYDQSTEYTYINYYDQNTTIVAADFFFIYYFFFITYPVLIILIATILGIFSIFFIFLFLLFKQLRNKRIKNNKKLYFIRKQQFTKQANYKTPMRTFQKIWHK